MEGKTNEVSVIKEEVAIQGFISQAIEKGLPVETMEKLFALRERAKAEYAKEEFMKAMAKFQADCPVIEKTKKVFEKGSDTKVRYSYADLGSIVEQVKKPLGENELSYDFITEDVGTFLNVTCTVTHALGHSKSSSFKIPIGTEAYMTDVQKYGARVTFAKRYAFCNALGILTGDEDIDSKEDDKNEKIPEELIARVKNAKTEQELTILWNENKGKGYGKEFVEHLSTQKKFIKDVNKDENANS